jgi:hypothetical protein
MSAAALWKIRAVSERKPLFFMAFGPSNIEMSNGIWSINRKPEAPVSSAVT